MGMKISSFTIVPYQPVSLTLIHLTVTGWEIMDTTSNPTVS